VLGIIMVHSFDLELDRRRARQNLPAEVLSLVAEQRERLAAAQLSDRFGEKVKAALKREIDQSFVFGFRRVMLTAAVLALASALVARKTIDSKR
jgi:hypothetical protein